MLNRTLMCGLFICFLATPLRCSAQLTDSGGNGNRGDTGSQSWSFAVSGDSRNCRDVVKGIVNNDLASRRHFLKMAGAAGAGLCGPATLLKLAATLAPRSLISSYSRSAPHEHPQYSCREEDDSKNPSDKQGH